MPNPYSTSPATNAYGWITYLVLDAFEESGRVTLSINLDEASANAYLPAISKIDVALGQTLVPATGNTAAVVFPNLTTLLTNAATLAVENSLDPYSAIEAALYEGLLLHPLLSGATII